ncbi:hypothetical protein GCM10022221_35400 [Actinocorallia aurea]
MVTDPAANTLKCAGGNWKSGGDLDKNILVGPMGDPIINAQVLIDTVSDVVGDCRKGDYDS